MATARPRQSRQPIEVRRAQVLDAALRLISRDGYAAATMEAIAREADIAKPVVYNAFGGRGALLQALLEREEAKAFAALGAALPPQPAGTPPLDLLRAWLRTLAEAIAGDPVPWRLMLMPDGDMPADVRAHVNAGRGFALDQLRAIVAGLAAQDPALARLDRELCAQALLGAAEHCARLMLADPETFPPGRLADFGESLLALAVLSAGRR